MQCGNCGCYTERFRPEGPIDTIMSICYKCGWANQELNPINSYPTIVSFDGDKFTRDSIIEKLSQKIHLVWTNWYLHQRDNSTPENIERWNLQSITPYECLSEEDKEKDRKIVRNLLDGVK